MRPKLYNGPWENWELDILEDAIANKTPWTEVAERLERRTKMACILKARKSCDLGKRARWTAEEDAIVIKYYPALGWKGVARHWPDGIEERTCGAIHRRAGILGIEQKNLHNPALDRALHQCYTDGKRAPVKRAAEMAGTHVKKAQYRARVLGLTVLPQPNKPWTAAETAMLERHPELSAPCMSLRLKKAGYGRTASAVMQRRQLIGISGLGEWMTPSEVGRLLGGFDPTTVVHWIRQGLLKARMRGVAADADHYLVSNGSLRDFVLAFPHRIRPHWANIDPTWLLAGLIAQDDAFAQDKSERA